MSGGVEVVEADLMESVRIAHRHLQKAVRELQAEDVDFGHVYADVKTALIFLRGYADEQE